MKIKGITIWEQYVERIVLAVAGLVLVGFLALQFVGEPNAVDIGGETYTPSDVNEKLEEEAQRLAGNLAPNARSPLDISQPDTVADDFTGRLDESMAPRQLAVAIHPAYSIGDGITVASPDQPYRLVSLPAPANVRHQQYFDGLAQDAVLSFTQLAERYPQQPYDISWVTVAATFDMKSVRAMLSTPGPNGELPVPDGWYNSKLPLMFVRVEREELVNGGWTNLTTLDPIPGQASLVAEIESPEPTSADRRYVFEYLADPAVQRDVLQPLFYSTTNNSWAPPNPNQEPEDLSTFEEDDPEQRKINSLRRQLRKRQQEYDRNWAQLDELGGPLDSMPGEEKPPKSGGGPGGSDDDGLMGGGGSGTGLKDPNDDKREAVLRQRVNLTKLVKRLEKQIAGLRDRLTALVGAEEETPESTTVDELADADQIVMWAHDLDVAPHKTYRYRFMVDAYNPYFGKKLNLIDEQQQLAERLVVRSPASEWSEPLSAHPPLRVFVTAASPSGSGAVGSRDEGWARAEVFRFHDGRWWMENFRVGPGDRIGGIRSVGERGSQVSIDFRTDWFLLDVFTDLNADDRATSRDRAGTAILQSLSTGEVMEVREPTREARSIEREDLQGEVDTADAGGEIAVE